MFERIDKGFTKIEDSLALLSGFLILAIMFLETGGVGARSILNSSISSQVDMVEIGLAMLVAGGLGFSQRIGAHIYIETLYDRLKGRSHHLVSLFHLFLEGILIGGLVFFSFQTFVSTVSKGQVTFQSYLPLWPASLLLFVGFAILFCRIVLTCVHHFSVLKGKRVEAEKTIVYRE